MNQGSQFKKTALTSGKRLFCVRTPAMALANAGTAKQYKGPETWPAR